MLEIRVDMADVAFRLVANLGHLPRRAGVDKRVRGTVVSGPLVKCAVDKTKLLVSLDKDDVLDVVTIKGRLAGRGGIEIPDGTPVEGVHRFGAVAAVLVGVLAVEVDWGGGGGVFHAEQYATRFD